MTTSSFFVMNYSKEQKTASDEGKLAIFMNSRGNVKRGTIIFKAEVVSTFIQVLYLSTLLGYLYFTCIFVTTTV